MEIYFKDGAEFMEKHPGLIIKKGFSVDAEKVTAKQIKIFFGLGLIGGIFGMVILWVRDISLPPF